MKLDVSKFDQSRFFKGVDAERELKKLGQREYVHTVENVTVEQMQNGEERVTVWPLEDARGFVISAKTNLRAFTAAFGDDAGDWIGARRDGRGGRAQPQHRRHGSSTESAHLVGAEVGGVDKEGRNEKDCREEARCSCAQASCVGQMKNLGRRSKPSAVSPSVRKEEKLCRVKLPRCRSNWQSCRRLWRPSRVKSVGGTSNGKTERRQCFAAAPTSAQSRLFR